MASTFLRWAIEFVLIALVCLAPWGFGGFEPVFEALLDLGLLVLLVLWGLRMIFRGRLTWVKCPVALCLVCMFWFGVCQLLPLRQDLLASISPATARLYQSLLPAQPEKLPVDVAAAPSTLVSGKSLSVYPGKTRQELFRLLAVLLVFSCVRNNIASPASLYRLFIALAINGSFLALFAIVQFFSSRPGVIYWTFQTPGSIFGPFICRTHFAFYLNVCIGAGVGLLMVARRRSATGSWNAVSLAERPVELWLIFALALMCASVLFSLSRGGFLALLAGFMTIFFLRPRHTGKPVGWLVPAMLMAILAVGLLGWLGLQRVEERLTTLASGEALKSRLPMWKDACRLIPDFPLLGTGWGTFAFVEPLHRTDAAHHIVHEFAHNELLEALVEGGVVRLGLTLLLIGLIFVPAVRAVRRYGDQPIGALALGALFGFSTLVFQSFGDFGIHLPAIALLAAVLSAQIVSLERVPASSPDFAGPDALPAENVYSFRLGMLAPIGGTLVLLCLGLLVLFEGWRTYRAETYRDYARTLQGRPEPEAGEVRVNNLEMAVRFSPDHVRLRSDLAQAHLDSYDQRVRVLRECWAFATVAQIVMAPTRNRGDVAFPAAQIALNYRLLGTFSAEQFFHSASEAAAREHLYPSLRQFALARDVCPLLAQPQMMLASYRSRFQKAEPRRVYLDRARLLVTNDPALYFLFGLEYYLDGEIEQAAASWRRSLELGGSDLPAIFDLTRSVAGKRSLYDRILPDDPRVLLSAGDLLKGMNHPADHVSSIWERALVHAQSKRSSSATAGDLEVQARLLRRLKRSTEAVPVYRAALALEPRQVEWRFDLAQLLAEQKHYDEARIELDLVLGLKPSHAGATELLKRVVSEMVKTR